MWARMGCCTMCYGRRAWRLSVFPMQAIRAADQAGRSVAQCTVELVLLWAAEGREGMFGVT